MIFKSSENLLQPEDLNHLSAPPRDCQDFIRREFLRGIDVNDPFVMGYHGTSIESLRHVLKEGVLPGALLHNGTGYSDDGNRYLFFMPRSDRFRNHALGASHPLLPNKQALAWAEQYAQINARGHFIIETLGLNIENTRHHELAFSLAVDPCIRDVEETGPYLMTLRRMGFKKDQLLETAAQAQERHGVVLGLSRTALRSLAVSAGDAGEPDLKIELPNGLPFFFICGIKSLGQAEDAFLKNLGPS